MTDQTIDPAVTPVDPADTGAVLADGRPFIRCGCGLLIVSDNAYRNREAFEEHNCPLSSGAEDRAWYVQVLYFLSLCAVLFAVLLSVGVVKL